MGWSDSAFDDDVRFGQKGRYKWGGRMPGVGGHVVKTGEKFDGARGYER